MANIELDGANKKIKVDSGDLTLDIPGDIILDADGANVTFKDGGTSVLDFSNSSTDAVLTVSTQDKDLIIKGDDGGSAITAATFDMSDAGTLVLNHDLKVADDGKVGSASAADAMTISSGGIVTFKDDILIKDGGTIGVASVADAMTVSSGGIVTFKDDILIKDGGTIGSASDADSITIASNGAVTFSQTPVFPDGSIAIADLDIDGGTDIGEAIVDADLFIIDNGAGGTNRKTAASRLKTYIGSAGLVHINTISISSSTADATFLHGTNDVVLNDGTYENFLIIGSGIQISNDDDQIRVSFSIDAGSNYNAQTYRATDHVEMTQSGSSGSASQDAQSSAGASSIFGAMGNNLGNTGMFTMFLFNLNSTTMKKTALVEALEEQHNTIYKKRSSFITIAERTTAVDGIRFNCNAGTFSKATFRLYGITNG